MLSDEIGKKLENYIDRLPGGLMFDPSSNPQFRLL